MVETTRSHPRLPQATPEGRRIDLELGTLFVPEALADCRELPVFLHFHGGTWLPEVAASRAAHAAVITIQLGSGSSAYARAFVDATSLQRLLTEAQEKSGLRFTQVGLTAWSAGYGAVREVLKVADNYERIDFVVLIDGLHASYASGKPGPRESELAPAHLEEFLRFARDAVAGNKQMVLTHSEVFPGTYASTTETADYLLKNLGLRRTAVLKWGPMGTQQLSEVQKGKFLLVGYAGNSAPDHVDQLHSLPDYLEWIDWGAPDDGETRPRGSKEE
jgi:hypothetical protein